MVNQSVCAWSGKARPLDVTLTEVVLIAPERAPPRLSPDRALEVGSRRTAARTAIVAMSIESLRQVRDHFSDVVDRVEREYERVTVTRNGRAAAVLISPDDLAQLEETLDVLGDPDALADIREADAAYARGDVVRGVAAVRALHP